MLFSSPPVFYPWSILTQQWPQYHQQSNFGSYALPVTRLQLPKSSPIQSTETATSKKIFRPWEIESTPKFAMSSSHGSISPASATTDCTPKSTSQSNVHTACLKETRIRCEDENHEQLESVAASLGKDPKGSGYRCVYCGKSYSRKYGLKIHLRTHTGYKPLACKVCGRCFGDPSNLNKHVRLHSTQHQVSKKEKLLKLYTKL